jgi:hypothetical protein
LTQEAPVLQSQADREARVQVQSETKSRFDLSVPQILAGALAAASAAVAASWLGVAGTVIGAMVASLVASVTTALYAHPLEKSSRVIRETLPVVPERTRALDSSLSHETAVFGATDPTQVLPADGASLPAYETVTTASETRSRRIQWGPVFVSSVLTLVIGIGILTGAEALLGGSFSSITGSGDSGGTTISHLVHHGDSGSTTTPQQGDNGNGGATSPEPTVPTDTQPTDPTPTEPTPTDPTPTEPTPTDPTTTDPGATTPSGGVTTGGANLD